MAHNYEEVNLQEFIEYDNKHQILSELRSIK